MEPNETMVEEVDNTQVDDTPVEEVVEEMDESEEEGLDSFTEAEAPTEEPKETQSTSEEPGWFRRRWDKEVGKLTEKIRSELRDEYEAQMAPIRAKLIEDEAQELVRSRKIGDIETAREYVRLRNGQPAQAPTQPAVQEQPRQANGQFAPKKDPAMDTRISMLRHQAEKIAEDGGPDVRKEFTNNPEIKDAVIRGDMDFYDVAKYMKSQKKKNPPSPMRSPNGANGNSPNAIATMSDEQFARMEKRISEGARIRLS